MTVLINIRIDFLWLINIISFIYILYCQVMDSAIILLLNAHNTRFDFESEVICMPVPKQVCA